MTSRQLISEFRALRATVIRLWTQSNRTLDDEDLYDLTRFNEAIDEILSAAEARYSLYVEQSRELFLGILGHDLRNPLSAISGAGELLSGGVNSDKIPMLADQISSSTRRMSHMITNLLELTRVRLGTGIKIKPVEADMSSLCLSVVQEMRTAYPRRAFKLETEENIQGKWDISQLKQVLSNLIGNAVQHGAADLPVTVQAKKTGDSVEIKVHNGGPVIPPEKIETLFDCFVQGDVTQMADKDSTSVGLGLYIAKEIITAHKGSISAHSSASEGTTFTARLPLKCENS